MKKLFFLTLMLSMTTLFAAAKQPPTRKISADIEEVKGAKSEMYLNCVGAGRAAEGLRASWRDQLRELQEEVHFEYIRFHGLFHDDMGVYREAKNGRPIYNFQYIDDLYDFLLSVGIRPFVEMSFMPDAMKSGEKTVFWWKGHTSPPADYEKWGELIRRFTQHVTDRYGREEVSKWYFEVWNEPNHPSFFSGTKEEYLKMYKYAARAVKSVDESYRIGGPATAGNGWVPDIIDFCNEENVPLDFVATHTYGVHSNFDEFGVKRLQLRDNENYISECVNRTRSTMDSMDRKDAELHYTEWNTSSSPLDYVHDTYLNAPFILNVLRKIDDNVQSMSYWTFTDIFEEAGPPKEAFHGGFGLMTLRGLKKPAYFAFKYLNEIGQTEVKSSDAESWVCKDENGDIQVLTYNITLPTYKSSDYNNSVFAKERIPARSSNINIELKNVPNGNYYVEVYKIGYLKKDIQTLYIKMGRPKGLTRDQHDVLEMHARDIPESAEYTTITDGKFSIELPEWENDVYFVKLKYID